VCQLDDLKVSIDDDLTEAFEPSELGKGGGSEGYDIEYAVNSGGRIPPENVIFQPMSIVILNSIPFVLIFGGPIKKFTGLLFICFFDRLPTQPPPYRVEPTKP
jgi:hypothetical protein